MKIVDQATFVSSIRPGDIGLVSGGGLFATVQDWYRKRFKEGPEKASHGFFVKTPPTISEADGIIISEGTFLKNIGDSTKVWFFRYNGLTTAQFLLMLAYCNGAEQTGGHYSVGGIWQFIKSYVLGTRKGMSDEGGVFCSEYTSKIILAGGLSEHYIKTLPPYEIDPSSQLNWFLTVGVTGAWSLAAHYDGQQFLIEERQEKEAA